MILRLSCHPDFPAPAIRQVKLGVKHEQNGDLRLRYTVAGDIDAISLPAPCFPGRADGLWQTTCFEFFVRPEGQAGYFEFNFSPSSAWAAYGFSDYRQGMSEIGAIMRPRITTRIREGALEVTVMFSPGLLASWSGWAAGASAIIEMKDGSKSFWALAHPPGAPDFHHRDCFATRLSPSVLI